MNKLRCMILYTGEDVFYFGIGYMVLGLYSVYCDSLSAVHVVTILIQDVFITVLWKYPTGILYT